MGGKSGSSNNQMLQFEMQQAAEAKQKEADRQARLEQGKTAVNQIFQGGGFDDAFYNKYKGAELDYSLPQLQDQFKKQKDQSTYDLARAGTLRSKGAGDVAADLEKQRIANESSIRTKADTDVATLRSGIQGQEQSALNQLYATEDPSVAANTATGMVQQGQLSQPNLQPLGELFKPLVIGSIAAGGNLVDQYNINRSLQTRPPGGQGSVNYS